MNQPLKVLLLLTAIGAGVTFAMSPGVQPTGDPARTGTLAPLTPVDTGSVLGPLRCPPGGYLCADVERAGTIRVRRWTAPVTTLVVHVPVPDFEAPAEAARLQSAAAAGVRAWNGHPFPVRIETRSDEGAHFSVRWVRTLGGDAVGVARTRWSLAGGLQVTAVDLATRNPFAPDVAIDPAQVRLTAAHEMGHALGLPHSDFDRDVMYPRNTASSLTARDYRSMESLYGLPDGAELAP
ncbi:MAG: matrixin family metalloprotease [Gemmatimonadota bacterium]